MTFKTVKKSYGYVIINKTLNTHAHLPNYKGCAILLHLIKNNVEIEDSYLRNAKERLLPKKVKKDRYYNRPVNLRGV